MVWCPFVGTSMSPYIKDGDMLLVQHVLRRIRMGDVVVFKYAECFIAHRVVFIKKRGKESIYRTKGDNARYFDAPVLQSSVLGLVVRIKKTDKLVDLQKAHIKFLNFILALFSCTSGIFFQLVNIQHLFIKKVFHRKKCDREGHVSQ